MIQATGSVQGVNHSHQVVFYGLSTCIWCRKTRQYLEDEGIAFDFFYVDLLQGQEREDVLARVRRWNPAVSFPTIVVDGVKSITGYRPEEIAETLR